MQIRECLKSNANAINSKSKTMQDSLNNSNVGEQEAMLINITIIRQVVIKMMCIIIRKIFKQDAIIKISIIALLIQCEWFINDLFFNESSKTFVAFVQTAS